MIRGQVVECVLSLLGRLESFRFLSSLRLSKLILQFSLVRPRNGKLDGLSTYSQYNKQGYDQKDLSLVGDRWHRPARCENDERDHSQTAGDWLQGGKEYHPHNQANYT